MAKLFCPIIINTTELKNILLLLLSFFLFCQCADNNATGNGQEIKKTKLKLSSSSKAEYENLKTLEKEKSPIERLCIESKGYRKDEWDALNECSWAVEKHQMNLHTGIAERRGGQLFLNFADSTHILIHQADEYYQFVDYLPQTRHLIVRVLRPLACPMYWLLNGKTGEKTVLSGEPVLADDKKSFMLSTSSDSRKINCPKTISYWSFVDEQFQELGFLKNKKGIKELLWKEESSWIGKEDNAFVEIRFQ